MCGLVVGVPGYRFKSPGSIPGATRFTDKWSVWSFVSTIEELQYMEEKIAAPVYKF
jgi:hypothetical protein